MRDMRLFVIVTYCMVVQRVHVEKLQDDSKVLIAGNIPIFMSN